MKIRNLKVRTLANGSQLATYTIEIDGTARKASSFVPRGMKSWQVETWLVFGIQKKKDDAILASGGQIAKDLSREEKKAKTQRWHEQRRQKRAAAKAAKSVTFTPAPKAKKYTIHAAGGDWCRRCGGPSSGMAYCGECC